MVRGGARPPARLGLSASGWWSPCGRWPACDTFQTEQTGYPQVIVPAIFAPIGFLAGLGAFDYWFRWAIGGPTYPADLEHKDHGAQLAGATTSSSTPITR